MDTRITLASLLLLAGLCVTSAAFAEGADCGNPFVNSRSGMDAPTGYGPFDYRTATAEQRALVENHHFTSQVQTLRSGVSGPLGADIDYTLRAFPNHPRALMAMVRLGEREKLGQPRGANYTVECYIDRAIRYTPDDYTVRQIRGIYLSAQGKHGEAIEDFKAVVAAEPQNANAHYNLGLEYFETKDYDAARKQAKIAQELKFPLDGLEKMLRQAGKWSE
jgi:tetratricopeptide (TPR) repeat protein